MNEFREKDVTALVKEITHLENEVRILDNENTRLLCKINDLQMQIDNLRSANDLTVERWYITGTGDAVTEEAYRQLSKKEQDKYLPYVSYY
jgi:predicted RNase H-like nuclease (RuvC/YqgF family)